MHRVNFKCISLYIYIYIYIYTHICVHMYVYINVLMFIIKYFTFSWTNVLNSEKMLK